MGMWMGILLRGLLEILLIRIQASLRPLEAQRSMCLLQPHMLPKKSSCQTPQYHLQRTLQLGTAGSNSHQFLSSHIESVTRRQVHIGLWRNVRICLGFLPCWIREIHRVVQSPLSLLMESFRGAGEYTKVRLIISYWHSMFILSY